MGQEDLEIIEWFDRYVKEETDTWPGYRSLAFLSKHFVYILKFVILV